MKRARGGEGDRQPTHEEQRAGSRSPRISGVYASPTIDGAEPRLPRRPIRVRFHLRYGLDPGTWPGITVEETDLPTRAHALVLDAAADPELLDQVLRSAAGRRENGPEAQHAEIYVCGVLASPVLQRLATVAKASVGSDPTEHDGLHFITQMAVRAARLFARRDIASRREWAETEIGPWIVKSAYAEARLTPKEGLILALHILGFSRGEIQTVLGVGDNTVKTHVHRLLQKTGHSEISRAIVKLHKALGPVAPNEHDPSPLDGVTTQPRITLDGTRTPPGGLRI